jgi:quercetin dioxygenase-like cupin family protein
VPQADQQSWRLVEHGRGRALTVGAALTTIVLPGEATDGQFSISEYDLFPGFPGPPAHVHREWRHVFHVTEGAISVTLDGQEMTVTAGGTVWIPAGVVHAFSNPGAQRARVLAVDSPGGFERYYEELSEAFPPGSQIDQARIAEIQRRYDTYPPEAMQ